MNSYKRILLIVVLTIAGITLLASAIAYLKRDEIKNLVVQSINENLNRKVDVENISFSLISNFPYAAVTFENVTVHESKEFTTTGHVLNAKQISLLFSLSSIFNKEYKLKKIVLTNATLNLQIDSNGNSNYEIWKKDENNSQKKDSLNLELQDVVLENVDVFFYNQLKKQDISFLVNNGSLKGDFKSERYVLNSDAELENTSVIIEKVHYLSAVDCVVKLSLEINKKDGNYIFRKSSLQLAKLVLNLDGNIKDTKDFLELDLKISSPSADLPALLSLIPETNRRAANDYNYSGKVEFGGTIKGLSGKNSYPVIAFDFKSIGVNLNPKNSPYHLKNMNGKGFFTNRKNKASPVTYLRLENFTATLEGKPLKVDLEVENFTKPRLKLNASVEADLKALSRFYMPDTLEEISGNLFADIIFNGIADEKSTYQSSGTVRFEQVNFKLKQKPLQFTGFSGQIHLRGNDVMVENISGSTGKSDFLVNGSFNNLMAWLLLENQKLNILATLVSNKIDLNELMVKDLNASQKADTVYKIDFSDNIKFRTDAKIGELTFNKFKATDIGGTVTLESKVLTTKDLDFNTAGGSVRLIGVIDDRPANHLIINYDALINKLDIRKLFYEMGNFGQGVLIDKNLKGIVTAEIQFRSEWSDRLEVNEKSIYVKSDITIENGELIDFEPMLALSKFLKGADLKAIKFSTLTNTIEIKNRKIFIPIMEIKSNALDITASGEHTFDNIVDYKLRLYLSQILGKKVKQQNTEFGTIEDDGLGRTMLFLSMKGPMADPKFEWDRKSVEKKISDEIKNETKTLKNILKEEFGKKDPEKPANSTKQENKKQEELQIDYEDEE